MWRKAVHVVLMIAVCIALCCSVAAEMRIAENGIARCVIVTQPGATPAERHAASDLAATLKQITGAEFEIRETASDAPASAIVVGPGPLATSLFPDIDLTRFTGEESVMRTRGDRLLLAGGRPRGTLYAVYRFLQDRLGVRWWTPFAARIPRHGTLMLGGLNVRSKPLFESRDLQWPSTSNVDWAARNCLNGSLIPLDESRGGHLLYTGFVHTFSGMVPTDPYFKTHPEWFAMVNGKRVADQPQLCCTNPELRDFIVERVRAMLRAAPNTDIISVSQNDGGEACQCPKCAEVDRREGSHAGSLLELVNHVAARIAPEFPHVAVDTLAYQHTQKAPRALRPLPNVVIRLCSGAADFVHPMDAPVNEPFASDIRGWSRLTKRLYIWDYTTNFSQYAMPHPNWYMLGQDLRFFHRYGTRGVLSLGSMSLAAEMAELKAWVSAQLLWNPYQDDRALVREFAEGYFGKASAPYILRYFDLVMRAAQPYYLGAGHPETSPYLRFPILAEAERLWQKAEDAARGDRDLLWRVRQGHVAVQYIWLMQWVELRRECMARGAQWPISTSRKDYAARWLATVNEPGPPGWVPLTALGDFAGTVSDFMATVAGDADESLSDPPSRHAVRGTPDGLPPDEQRSGIDAQDDRAVIFREGECASLVADPAASDGVAIRMVAGAADARGAMEIHGGDLPKAVLPGRYRVYCIVRVDKAASADPKGVAFTARVVDPVASGVVANAAERDMTVAECGDGYRAHLIGIVNLHRYMRIWLGHARDAGVKAVWFDRAWLVPVK